MSISSIQASFLSSYLPGWLGGSQPAADDVAEANGVAGNKPDIENSTMEDFVILPCESDKKVPQTTWADRVKGFNPAGESKRVNKSKRTTHTHLDMKLTPNPNHPNDLSERRERFEAEMKKAAENGVIPLDMDENSEGKTFDCWGKLSRPVSKGNTATVDSEAVLNAEESFFKSQKAAKIKKNKDKKSKMH